MCDKYCARCLYFNRDVQCCDYIFEVGKQRGCESGEKCTKRNTGSKSRKKAIVLNAEVTTEYRRKKKEEYERRMTLYLQGLSDKSIAEALGMSKGGVESWRRANMLPPNFDSAHRQINRGNA